MASRVSITFWGAAREVTGSMHLIETDGRRILLDCGLYQGKRKHAFERNRNLPFPASSIDAVILSHAHIDHSGNLPSLIRSGYRGPIYATSATRDLCVHMLLDSAHIQEEDVRHVNKIRRAQGKRPFEPLYTREDAVEAINRIVSYPYHVPFQVADGLTVTFYDAGHMLGSALVAIDFDDGSESRRLVFSGDLGRPGFPMLRDPEHPEGVVALVMEGTYGDRCHPSTDQATDRLKEVVLDAVRERGIVIIPAFAVGRTQQIVYRLNLLHERGEIPEIPVYVDSPLATDVTEVYRNHPECYDREMLEALFTEADHNPLGFRGLTYIRRKEASKALNEIEGPAVIISPQGMCEGGRVLHHLMHHIGDPRTTIVFVGYQAQHTLGRYLREGAREVRIFGRPFRVEARVEAIDGFSCHADQHELLGWVRRISEGGRLSSICLVHGEEAALATLARAIEELGIGPAVIPSRGETCVLA